MSETSNKALHANENVRWFRLGGKTQEALLRTIELTDKDETPSKDELNRLANCLGMKFMVARNDTFYGLSAHRPEVFKSPIPSEENTFYMLCPRGDNKTGSDVSFIPEDSVELNEEEINLLQNGLFMPWGQATPVLQVEPIQLTPKL